MGAQPEIIGGTGLGLTILKQVSEELIGKENLWVWERGIFGLGKYELYFGP